MHNPLQTAGVELTRNDRQAELPATVVESIPREHLLLRGLLAVAAGFSQGFRGPSASRIGDSPQATFLFCVKGVGWWEGHGRLSLVRKGDVLVLPPHTAHTCGPQASNPWTVHWVRAAGDQLPEFLRALALRPENPVLRAGEDPQLVRLFDEILRALQRGAAFASLLQASQATGYLLSCLIQKRQNSEPENTDTARKAAQAIVYMSEHLTEPLRVSVLARLAGLSSAYFGDLFKQHTSCSPREYLHLLRMYQACRLLQDSDLSVKEIAGRVGYRDPLHFSRQFRDFQGVSPRQYRGGCR